MSSKDLVEDAHLKGRGFFVRLPHPQVGTQTHTGIPWILTNAPNGVRSPAPLLGSIRMKSYAMSWGYRRRHRATQRTTGVGLEAGEAQVGWLIIFSMRRTGR